MQSLQTVKIPPVHGQNARSTYHTDHVQFTSRTALSKIDMNSGKKATSKVVEKVQKQIGFPSSWLCSTDDFDAHCSFNTHGPIVASCM